MSLGIKHLSQNITPDTSGIIWITDEDLDYKTPGVYEFNYLLDGMLIKSITKNSSQEQRSSKSNFFLGENFGTPLFIGHLKVKDKSDIQTMYDQMNIASPIIKEQSTIYIFNRSKNTANINILKELGKKYQNYTFKNLNI
jgi:hypothetical protein